MVVGVLKMDLYLPESGSLKSKRFVVKSLKDRLRNKFNVSVAEDGNDLWQRVSLYCACISNDVKQIHSTLESVKNMAEKEHMAELLDYSVEIN
ncbi:MAG: DUF503 domain-containing protein [Nitrospirae bacterium]|nr:DUF503 domain-containing protein [Nitrospirota bacterium]